VSEPGRSWRRRLHLLLVPVVLIPLGVGFFWLAGRADWWAGWGYVGLMVVGQSAVGLYLVRHDPELLRRRGQWGKGTPVWDRVCLSWFGLAYLGVPVVGALEARHGGEPAVPWWLWGVAAGLYGLSLVGLGWAMGHNTHFEKTVRLQQDRGHRVIDTGPYAIVRHPGYVCVILGLLLAPPVLLQSWWAMIPAALGVVALVVRTSLEDRFLHNQLAGYTAYAARVRYRLLPGLW
jgi:protein-S-isoprenylcysteine O-methyltransferase Ste14